MTKTDFKNIYEAFMHCDTNRFRTSAGPCDNCQLVFLATRLSQQTLL